MGVSISNKSNNYLFGSNGTNYSNGLLNCLSTLQPFLTKDQIKRLHNDLQLEGDKFDESKYLQAACETTVTSYFCATYGDGFVYEHKINPPKDVDCSFVQNRKNFYIEVKCADFSKKNKIDNTNAFRVSSFGRLENHQEIFAMLQPVFSSDKPLLEGHKMDNKLKDYLKDAHNKFKPLESQNELNILVVNCGDWCDIQHWYSYLFAHQGLFTKNAFCSPTEFDRVDVVMFTNLYHRHHEYWLKDKISGHWDLSKSFNLIFSNPFRKMDKREIIENFVDNAPNHSRELACYKPIAGLESLRISTYVCNELLGKELFYFQPNNNKQ